MEANLCDINHLDSDVLLPPRKRLLAGLKKQNSDVNSHQPPTTSNSTEFDSRLSSLMRSHSSNPNFSHDEIVESSRLEVAAAVKAAKAARIVADEKAAIAAKAIAAAKSALEMVATVSEEATSNERYLKKNKMKKQVPVKMLYNKHRRVQNCKADEELARNLHRVINSSPRISKSSPTSELKNNKHKRLKGLCNSDKTRDSNGGMVWDGNPASKSNGNGVTIKEGYTVRVDDKISKFFKTDRLKMGNGEAETSQPKEKMLESPDDTCRKRGRLKQKKLPLSICTFRDRGSPKEELKSESSPSTDDSTGKPTSNNKHLMPIETSSMWKCQAFKAPVCVKQNKVVQS